LPFTLNEFETTSHTLGEKKVQRKYLVLGQLK